MFSVPHACARSGNYVGHNADDAKHHARLKKLDTAGDTATWLFGATLDNNRTHSNKPKRTLVSSNPHDTTAHNGRFGFALVFVFLMPRFASRMSVNCMTSCTHRNLNIGRMNDLPTARRTRSRRLPTLVHSR